MSSESDSALSVGSSGDESDIRVESDEELLNDDTVERKEKPSQEKHKRSYDSRYAVPTLEERQLMRDAEMQVELSMLELEVGCWVALLLFLGKRVRGKYPAGHPCAEKVTAFLKSINAFLSQMPDKDVFVLQTANGVDSLQGLSCFSAICHRR